MLMGVVLVVLMLQPCIALIVLCLAEQNSSSLSCSSSTCGLSMRHEDPYVSTIDDQEQPSRSAIQYNVAQFYMSYAH